MSNVDDQCVILCLNVLGLYGFHFEPMAFTFLGCFKNVHFILFDFRLLTHVCNSEFRNMTCFMFSWYTLYIITSSVYFKKKKIGNRLPYFCKVNLKGKLKLNKQSAKSKER